MAEGGTMQITRRARLGDLERTIMDRLWAIDPVSPETALTVREIHESLSTERDLAYTTVMTVLDRLTKKGMVSRERDGRAWRYLPVSTSEELTADLLRDSLEHIESSDRRAAMLHFLDAASPDEIDDLKAALAELESRQGRSAG
jgi:predicted transcriptional regulator